MSLANNVRDRDLLRILSKYNSMREESERLRAVLGDRSKDEHVANVVSELENYVRSVQSKSYTLPMDADRLCRDTDDLLSAMENVQRIANAESTPDSVRKHSNFVLQSVGARARTDAERLPRHSRTKKSAKGFWGALRNFEDLLYDLRLGSNVRDARSKLMMLSSMAPPPEQNSQGFFVRASGSLEQRAEAAKLISEKYGCTVILYKKIPYLGIHASDSVVGVLVHDLATLPAYFNLGRLESAHLFTVPAPRIHEAKKQDVLWGLDRVQAYDSHEAGLSGKGIRVGVVDTGVDYEHSEIKHAFGKIKGIDIFDGTDDPKPRGDYEQHGTHVSGTICGIECGVAPGAELYSIRALGANGGGSELFVVAGIEWALENGVHVVNMSLGSSFHSSALDEICSVAYQQGVLLVAAAGNSGDESDNYPAHLPGVVAVAAIDSDDRRASFSTINELNDVCAPGVNIYSCVPSGYTEMDGTSMATPHVSGCAALVLEREERVAEELERVLEKSSDKLGSRAEYGAGCVQSARASGVRSLELMLKKFW